MGFGYKDNKYTLVTPTSSTKVITPPELDIFFENPYKLEGDSGIKLINHLKKEGITSIITGEVGPKVSAMLEKEKMQLVLLHEEKIKIDEILNRLRAQ